MHTHTYTHTHNANALAHASWAFARSCTKIPARTYARTDSETDRHLSEPRARPHPALPSPCPPSSRHWISCSCSVPVCATEQSRSDARARPASTRRPCHVHHHTSAQDALQDSDTCINGSAQLRRPGPRFLCTHGRRRRIIANWDARFQTHGYGHGHAPPFSPSAPLRAPGAWSRGR